MQPANPVCPSTGHNGRTTQRPVGACVDWGGTERKNEATGRSQPSRISLRSPLLCMGGREDRRLHHLLPTYFAQHYPQLTLG